LLFGYDTGVISGAIIFIKSDFAVSTFMLEAIVSGVLVGAPIGALFGGRFADRFSRRRVLIATAAIFALGAIFCAVAQSPAQLIAGRILVGLGIGVASAGVPVYISEISPAHARGWQVSLFQLAITVGIMAAYIVDYAFSKSGNWRWMLGLAVIPALVFGLGMLFLPESPRWLLRRGRESEARGVLSRIRSSSEAEKELSEIQQSLSESQETGGWSDLLHSTVRPALVVGFGLAIFQQITGINTIIYYAPTIIQSAGIPSASGAILATVGIGLVNVLMTIVSMWLMDRAGRRPLLLTGIAGMIVTLGIIGYAFHGGKPTGSFTELTVVAMMAYVAFFAISLGPIFWLLISEIYPTKVRGLAGGAAATANWASNFVVSLTFLTLVEMLGASRTFWTYGVLAIFSWIFAYRYVPETKGKTLEQIESFWRRGTKPASATQM
ncbi:MAG TPA: sugar porter family MFS transporter, partial [Candidatus Acidoferrales bacterium]|nr:sugar porter family MFS transporter [Candidatus Acidoferrales bacterium]